MKHLKDSYVLEELKSEGESCLINKNKGKQREWKTNKETESKIVDLYNGNYNGFNFTHFLEKLNEQEKIHISYGALYRILKEGELASHSSNATP